MILDIKYLWMPYSEPQLRLYSSGVNVCVYAHTQVCGVCTPCILVVHGAYLL